MFYSLELQRSVESLNFTKISKEVGLRYNIRCFHRVFVTYLLTKVFELAIHCNDIRLSSYNFESDVRCAGTLKNHFLDSWDGMELHRKFKDILNMTPFSS